MLSKVYYKLKDKIEQIEANIAEYLLQQQGDPTSHRLFYFSLVSRNFKLIALEILSDLIKYFIILFSDPSQSFGILYEQKKLTSCPHSYIVYRQTQQKVRIFSASWFSSVVAATVIVSLIMNLAWGGRPFAQAATFNYGQTSWTGTASTTAYGQHINPTDRTDWNRYASTSDKIIASSTISLGTTSMSNIAITETNDVQFSLGNLGASTSIVSTGTDASIMPCEFDHGGADWTVTDNTPDPITGITYDASTTPGYIEIYGSHCNINTFTVATGTTVWVKAYNSLTDRYGKLLISASSSLINGTLDASGRGYHGSWNTGVKAEGQGGGGNYQSGSFGGLGGSGNGVFSNGTYGSYMSTFEMGSGGGSWNNISPQTAGAGGGAIGLRIINNLTINGAIKSLGADWGSHAGGGSGGGVYIITNSMQGIGSVDAGGANTTGSVASGGGGGGRIAIYYSSNTLNLANIKAYGGTSLTAAYYGGAGTIYLKAANKAYGDLIIDNNNRNGITTPIFSSLTNLSIDDLVVSRYAKVTNINNLTATNLTISTSSTLTNTGTTTVTNLGVYTGGSLTSSGDILASNLTIATSSTLISYKSITAFTTMNGLFGPDFSLGSTTIMTGSSSAPGTLNFPGGTVRDLTLNSTILQTSTLTTTGTTTVKSGTVITHAASSTAGLTITAGNIDVQSGGKIDVSSKGYQGTAGAGAGPGGGGAPGWRDSFGGGYGGSAGKRNNNGDPLILSNGGYGSFSNPVDLGSAGSGNSSWGDVAGGSGGGAVKIITANLILNGDIKSNGGDTTFAPGAGSGGSILVIATSSLSGVGSLQVKGGSYINMYTGVYGGVGGGGRIAVEYADKAGFSGSYQAYGGYTSVFGATYQGGAGTVYLKSTTQTNGDLIVDNNNQNGADTPILNTATIIDNMTVKGYANLQIPTGKSLTTQNLTIESNGTFTNVVSNPANPATSNFAVTGLFTLGNAAGSSTSLSINNATRNLNLSGASVLIKNNATLTHDANTTAKTNYIDWTVNNFTVEPGGKVDVSGKGYSSNNGPYKGATGADGGGHGGAGGLGAGGTGTNSTTTPLLGSAGGGVSGGAGGGYVHINASSTINGAIIANGTNGAAANFGGGAGGSILLEGTLSGTGSSTANGGAGHATGANGGGGGGIIKLPNGSVFSNQATGGAGTNGGGGGGSGAIQFYAFLNMLKFAKRGTGVDEEAESSESPDNNLNTDNNIFSHFFTLFNSVKNLLSYTLTTPVANAASADFTSGPMDTGVGTAYIGTNLKTLAATVNSTSTIKFQVSSSNSTSTGWTDFTGPNGASTTMYVLMNGTSTTITDTQHNNKRYLKYKVIFDTFDGTVPSFDDITITYDSVIYVTTGKWLEGNWYNSNDKFNYLGQVIFDTEDAADVRIQVRTASGTSATPDLANASTYVGPSGSTTYFMLNDSLGYCSTSTSPFGATTTRITCNIDGNSVIGDGSADQWFQWKVWLYSPGGVTPVIHEVGVTYVVNMAPEIEIVTPDDAEFASNPDVVASTTQRLPHQWTQFEKDDTGLKSGGSKIDMTGKVLIPLRAKDADTFATNANGSSTAVMPGFAEIKLQYCNLDDCSAAPEAIPYANWSYATTSSFQLFEANGDEFVGTTTIPVSASSSPIYYLVWTPGQEAGTADRYVPNFRLRAVVSDHEGGNSYGYAPTGIFQLDARKPHFNQPPHLDASVQVGNIVPSDIHLNMAEDTASTTGFWLYLTENGSLDQAGAKALGDGDGQTGWAPYNSTTTWQLSDWQSTVYTWFKDAYGNLSVASNTPPTPPTELMISDISNPGDANYRLFFSWKKIVSPDFAKYNIWRATSTTQCGDSDYACQSALNFTLLASTTDYIENAYTDTELDSAIRYYYKVTTESDVSNNYNISRFAAIINGKPDGNGASSDVTKPIISKIAVTATSTQAATIQWNTNETAKSLVHYLTETQYLSNAADITACAGGSGDTAACERIGTTTADLFTNAVSVGINGYSDNDEVGGKFGPHIVNLNKLEPGTNYYFQVTSRDPSGNESKEYQQTVNGSTTPLVFQTKPGPKIDSGPTESGLTNTTMTIGWTTTLPADSAVIYSTDYDGSNHLVTPIETKGSLSLTTDHEVRLTGLLPDTDYYYYIVSTDPDGNYAMDDNTLGGSTRYFSFRTSFDQAPPTLNSEPYCQPVVTDRNGTHQLVITSSTTEPAILDFDFGTSSDNLTQAIASTTYFDPISSSTIYDANQTLKQGNLAASTTYYFRYTFYDNSDNSTSTNIFSCNTIEPMVAKSELDILQANYDILKNEYDLASSTLIGKIPEDEVGFRIASSAAKMATETDIDESDATSTLWVQVARNGWYSLTRASAWVAASTTEALVGMIRENSIIDRIASTSEELKTDNDATSTDSLATTWVKKAREAWIPESQKGISEAEAQAREAAAKAAGTAAGKSSAGSSIIVIDKTDKVAPIISEVKAENITATSAVVSWLTNEEANSIFGYGESSKEQGESAGSDTLTKEHRLFAKYLLPATSYSYVVSSADSSGNLAKSSSFSFTTPELTADELLGLGSSTEAANINPETVQTAATKLMALLGGLSKIVSLGTLETTLSTQYDALDKIAGIIPAPILSGEPAVEITPTTATVRWHTDKAANSLIGYVPEAVYVSSRGDAAYTQTVGKSDELKSDHEVKIYNLKPETTYHFQLSSKAQFGPKSTSKDFSFKTRPEALEITTYSVNVVSPTKAIFKWITSAQTNSQTKITPYRGSKLMVDEAKLYLDKTPTTNHETLIDNLIAGVIYHVSLSGVDQKGTRIEKVIPSFSTTKDDLPPEITQIQTESALSQGKTIGVQTVIAWQTNEPTSCSIKYALGSKQEEKDLVDTTPAETGYSGKHSLVITKFKPGEVYSFRVYCLDSGDNQTISGTHTILTPKQRESVFDLIVRTMEQTFGWMGNVSK